MQVFSRLHRIGQEYDVTVRMLVAPFGPDYGIAQLYPFKCALHEAMSSDDDAEIAGRLQQRTSTLKGMTREFKRNKATGYYNLAPIPVARPGYLIEDIGVAAHSRPLPLCKV